MSLKKIQVDIDKWTDQFIPQYWPIHETLARLIEEVGEVAREINHLYGIKKKKETEQKNELGQELADVIFTVGVIANSQNIDLSEEWDIMVDKKLYGRDNYRYTKK